MIHGLQQTLTDNLGRLAMHYHEDDLESSIMDFLAKSGKSKEESRGGDRGDVLQWLGILVWCWVIGSAIANPFFHPGGAHRAWSCSGIFE